MYGTQAQTLLPFGWRSARLLFVFFSCLSCVSWFLFFHRLADRDLSSSHEARAAQDAQTILEDGRWGLPDRIMLFGLGVVIAALAWRYASIIAVPSREGLRVRNLVLTRSLEWPEIVGIQFGGGEPWVSLDLLDGDTLAVMAIQKADGEVAGREASRLAALVQAFGESREASPS